ncbi:hypothetical protein JCM3770_006685 [Rhodotorula araucariae]
MLASLFGPDPKLAFASRLHLLARPDVLPLTAPYWDPFLAVFDSPADVPLLLPAQALAAANPRNLATLVRFAALALCRLVASPSFPTDPRLHRNALNALRVLARTVPLVPRDLEDDLFWHALPDDSDLPPLAVRLLAALVDLLFVPGFTVAESLRPRDDASVVTYAIWEPGIASSTPAPPVPLSHLTARLEVLRLLTLLVALPSLLTPPGLFAVVPNRWRDALVSGAPAGRGDRNVVLCLLCSTLNTALGPSAGPGTPADRGDSLRARAARLAADAAKRTAFAAAGAGATCVGGPAVVDEPSARVALAGASLHFLACVLLEHAGAPRPPASAPAPTDVLQGGNVFAHAFARLHRAPDLALVLTGVLDLVERALAAPCSPAGAGDTGLASEAVVFLVRALALNRKFAVSVATTPRLRLRLVVALEACVLHWRADQAARALVRAASAALQAVSAEMAAEAIAGGDAARAQLAQEFEAPLAVENAGPRLVAVVKRLVEAQGIEWERPEGDKGAAGVSCAEFLMISLHAVLLPPPLDDQPASAPSSSPSRAALQALYPSRLLALANFSPFLRALGHDAATRLVRLWLAFSAPSWVMMEEGNPRLLYYLLETFNNVIHCNLDSNPHLLYSLTITLKRFTLLANFTLAQGIAEARRLRAASRRSRTRTRTRLPAGSGSGSGSGARVGGDDTHTPGGLASVAAGPSPDEGADAEASRGGSERARGKRPERALSVSSLAGSLGLSSSPGLEAGSVGSRSGSRTSLAEEGAAQDDAEAEAPFVGHGGFVPTEGWVASWRDGLPLDTLLVLLSTLHPLLASHDPSFPASPTPPSRATVAHVQTLLRSPAITALVPPSHAHEPKPRRLPPPSPASTARLAALAYGRVYLAALPFVRDTLAVQLFAVASAAPTAPVGGIVDGLSRGLGAEMERVGLSAVEVGGRVGGAVRGVLGRFAGAAAANGAGAPRY